MGSNPPDTITVVYASPILISFVSELFLKALALFDCAFAFSEECV
jgi:hypothetical protein